MENTLSGSPGVRAAKSRDASAEHLVVTELSPREWRRGRFGMTLFLISQAVPYFVLVNVRVMVAGTYIPPEVNRWMGGLLPLISLIVGIVPAWIGLRACRRDRVGQMRGWFTASILLGLFAIVTLLVPLWVHSWDVLSHYGEIYVTCLGVAAFYTTIAVVVMLGVVLRAAQGFIGSRNSFGPESAAMVWTFNTVAWAGLYVLLQLV